MIPYLRPSGQLIFYNIAKGKSKLKSKLATTYGLSGFSLFNPRQSHPPEAENMMKRIILEML
jgi:hypothetical protein